MGVFDRFIDRQTARLIRKGATNEHATLAFRNALLKGEQRGNPLFLMVLPMLRDNLEWSAELMNDFILDYTLGDDSQDNNQSPFGSTDMEYKALAASAIADYQADNGVAAAGEFDAAEATSKLSDFIGKLRSLGVNWTTIFNLVSLILPMITSGKVDWAAIWAAIQVLIPSPTPNPGPMNP